MKKFTTYVLEEVPANNAGGGAIDGIGVGPRGEPGVRKSTLVARLKRIKKREKSGN